QKSARARAAAMRLILECRDSTPRTKIATAREQIQRRRQMLHPARTLRAFPASSQTGDGRCCGRQVEVPARRAIAARVLQRWTVERRKTDRSIEAAKPTPKRPRKQLAGPLETIGCVTAFHRA